MRVVVGALALAALVAAIAAYGAFGANIWRWGCPSRSELERLRTPEEVASAFEANGIELEPAALAERAPIFRGAVLYRHSTPSVTASVLVCRSTCAIPTGLRFHLGVVLGNNVVLWRTAYRGQGGDEFSANMAAAIGEIDTGVDPDSRCYIN